MAGKFSVAGQRVPRRDAPDKATGAAQYTVDIKLPGMLYGKVLRSPYPHARVLEVDVSRAERLPGVKAVLTPKDLPNRLFNCAMSNAVIEGAPVVAEAGNKHHDQEGGLTETAAFVGDVLDQRVLTDRARFVGDAVAAVAAVSEAVAEEALDLIEVRYEKLLAVFDPGEAMEPGAPQVHDAAEGNVVAHDSFGFGEDVKKGFAESDYVVEGVFHTSKQKHAQLEPSSAVASFDPGGGLTVWSPAQAPQAMRKIVAGLFDIPEKNIRWFSPFVGGAFGHYTSLWAEPICVALAKKAGLPVKLAYTREEEFVTTDSRQPAVFTARMGVTKDATIKALTQEVVTDAGAYCCHAASTTAASMAWLLNLYRCENREAQADIVYTNTPYTGGMRGYGNPRGMFVLEQLVDMASEKIGMDPVEFRLKNIRGSHEPSWIPGLLVESSGARECLIRGAQKLGWPKKKARKKLGIKRRGVGVATCIHSSSAYPFLLERSDAVVKLNPDGSVHLLISPVEIGAGTVDTCAMIAAEELGLRPERIRVFHGDTDLDVVELGTFSSRSVYVLGMAVLQAARDAKTKALARAADKLDVSPEVLVVRDGSIYVHNAPKRRLSFAEVAADGASGDQAGETEGIVGHASHLPTNSPIFQACFAEVEVDTETGVIRPLRLVIAHDIGYAINPMAVEGQLEGGAIMGVGYALTEEFALDQQTGKVITDSFATYKIPSMLDCPRIDVILVETPVASGPYGAKSVGESGMICVAPAIANAVYDAVGVRVMELPITPERVLRELAKESNPCAQRRPEA